MSQLAVVPVVLGPLQALIAVLPGLCVALVGILLSMFKPRAMLNTLRVLWRQKVAVLLTAGVVTCITACIKLAPELLWPADVAAAEESKGDWQLFRGSDRRTGFLGGQDPASDVLNWAFDVKTKTFYSTPTILGNRVYAASADIGAFNPDGSGTIYCLDADTGRIAWEQSPSGYRATFSSPSIAGKYLVIGEGLHLCNDARVFCLDAKNKGKVLWEYRTKSHVESSPCIFDGKTYIGAGDDGYYCLNLEPEKGEAQVIWHKSGDDYLDAEGSPLVINVDVNGKNSKRFYAGLGMGGKAIICLDADTGDQIWRVPTPYPVFGPISHRNGRIYVGMGNGNFAEDAEAAREAHRRKLEKAGVDKAEIEKELATLGAGGAVWCLDAVTGKSDWKLELPRTVLGAVVLGNDALFFGSRDGHMYRCTYDGRVESKFQSNEAIVASPALAKEHVYFITTGGNLFSLRSDDLSLAWHSAIGKGGLFISSPTVARGHVYIGTDQRGLLCMGKPGVKELPNWSGLLGGPEHPGFAEPSSLPRRGKYVWRYSPQKTDGQDDSLAITGPCAAYGNELFVPIAEGSCKGLVALQLADDKKGKATEMWAFKTDLGCSGSPAVTAAHVFVVDGKVGDQGKKLSCLEREGGKPVWQIEIADDANGQFVITDNGYLYLEVTPGLPACYDFSGRLIWKGMGGERVTGSVLGAPAIRDSLMAIAAKERDGSRELIVMDRKTGHVLWRRAHPLLTAPVIQDKTVYAGTEQGLTAYRLVDGAPLWTASTGAVSLDFSIYRGKLACINQSNELFLLDLKGNTIAKLTDVHQGFPPILTRSGLVYQGETDLMIYDFAKKQCDRWAKSKWLGTPSSPMILSKSRVYYATAKKGLICVKEK